ncbi:MAG: class I SAM-dependent methyltransferase [Candidatus Eremiobacteraeota bacterium]|nr:class I SAM-dependent methyltransferase [Candidatus Eremiobacteraeota bacterium]
MASHDTENINVEVRKIWNANAAFWDERMGSQGNEFHRLLIEPAQEKLLELKPGDQILDIACGNGQFARRMAKLGAQVLAFDLAESFIAIARERSKEFGDRIHYCVLDAADRGQLEELGDKRFDGAVCTMALMDMAAIEPLAIALKKVLKAGGRFVFSILHPCFNSGRTRRVIEEEDRDGELTSTCSVMTSQYSTPFTLKGIGMADQPEVQYYFHRSLSVLFRQFFIHGFVLNGLEEPVCPEMREKSFFWKVHAEIPPALVARMILPGGFFPEELTGRGQCAII